MSDKPRRGRVILTNKSLKNITFPKVIFYFAQTGIFCPEGVC